MEGVAAPEAANNSAASGSFIPLLTLGIPSNVVTAMLLADCAFLPCGSVDRRFRTGAHPETFEAFNAFLKSFPSCSR